MAEALSASCPSSAPPKDSFPARVRAACELFLTTESDTKTAEEDNKSKPRSIRVGDIPIILRTLGLAPSEELLKAFIAQMRGVELKTSEQSEEEGSDEDQEEAVEELVDFETLIRSVVTATTAPENAFAYMAENDERLQRAFEALDVDGVGFVEIDRLREILTTQGEVMSHKEVDELLKCGCVDEDSGQFYYEDYIHMVTKADPIV